MNDKKIWAFDLMTYYTLSVDFLCNTIYGTKGEEWSWEGAEIEAFYNCLSEVVEYLKSQEDLINNLTIPY